MKRSVLFASVAAVAALALAGCGKTMEAGDQTIAAGGVAAPAPPDHLGKAAGAPGAGAPGAAAPVPATPMLAYRYSDEIQTPAKAIRGLMSAHEAACLDAGPSVCQLISREIHDQGQDAVDGVISLRATQAWLRPFRDGLEAQAKAAGGKLASNAAESEDLTRQIVDTGAALRAKATLRDRLQALIAERPGKLPDLLTIENELARVQGEIDSGQSELAVMQARVAMSQMTLRYRPGGIWTTAIGQSVRDSGALTVMVASGLIRLIAVLGPLALPVGFGAWFWRRRWASRPLPSA